MPKVSEEHLAAKQEQILQAAIHCFSHNGFHATGMAEVIRESSLSAGSVYRYYKSKDDLIAAIARYLASGLEEKLIQTTQNAATPTEALNACLETAQQIQREQEKNLDRLLPQLWAEALRNPEIEALVQKNYTGILRHFAGLAERWQVTGHLEASIDPRGFASVMLSLVQGYGLQKLLLDEQLDLQQYQRAAAALLASRR